MYIQQLKKKKKQAQLFTRLCTFLSNFGATSGNWTHKNVLKTKPLKQYITCSIFNREGLPFVSSVVVALVNPFELVFADDVSGAPGSLVVPLGGANRSTASVMEISGKPVETHTNTVTCDSLHTRLHLLIHASILELFALICRFN